MILNSKAAEIQPAPDHVSSDPIFESIENLYRDEEFPVDLPSIANTLGVRQEDLTEYLICKEPCGVAERAIAYGITKDQFLYLRVRRDAGEFPEYLKFRSQGRWGIMYGMWCPTFHWMDRERLDGMPFPMQQIMSRMSHDYARYRWEKMMIAASIYYCRGVLLKRISDSALDAIGASLDISNGIIRSILLNGVPLGVFRTEKAPVDGSGVDALEKISFIPSCGLPEISVSNEPTYRGGDESSTDHNADPLWNIPSVTFRAIADIKDPRGIVSWV